MQTKELKPRVSKITIGRLYNLGNYEHVRYELAVDVPDGASAAAVFASTVRLLRAVNPKPPCSKFDLESARQILGKSADHLTGYERERLDGYRATVAAHEEWIARRTKAISLFDTILRP